MSYYYGSNNVLAMYIDSSGAVGFGTSNTSNAPGYVTFSNPINLMSGIQNPNASYTGNVSDGPGMPSFTWYDTSNYGMFRASNNVIGFSTSSLERARVDASGRFGVGLSNPQYLLDVAGPINALGYCNLLSNVVNSTSVFTAPTNNALNTVNLQSTWGCNLAVTTSNIVFNPSTNPNNVQGNYTCNLAVTSSNQLYPMAIYSSNYISSNVVTFSNISLINSLSNSGNFYSACNMVLGCNLNLTSLCNFGTSYFASNVIHSNTLSNLGNAYFASNIILNYGQGLKFTNNTNYVIGTGYNTIGNADMLNITTPGSAGLCNNYYPIMSVQASYSGWQRIGILNSNPQYTLDVNGNINAASNLTLSNILTIYSVSGVGGNIIRIRNLDTVNQSVSMSIGNSLVGASNYSTILSLYNYGAPESSCNTERLQFKSDSSGGAIQWLTTGTGNNRPLNIYNSNIFNPDGSVVHSNTVNTGSVTINNSSSNTLFINSKGSQSTFGQIIFTNTSATGDLRITGDGGDLYWQGGGGRTLQMAAYHGITLMGGRTSGIAPAFVNGSGSLYNTGIQNMNNSIGLIIMGATGQTADLMQLRNSGGTVVSRANSNGLYLDSNNNPPTEGNKINMLALSNSTGTYTPSIGTNSINVQIMGAGGGGGGATGNSAAAGGGGAGGNCIVWITGIALAASYTYAVGIGGTGTTGNGGTGGNTTLTVNGVVYMGIGGSGGLVINAANGASLGGVGGSTSNGLITNYGMSGRSGMNGFYTVVSGSGGSTVFGQGGEGRTSAGPGQVGQGYGAGGGGAIRNTTSQAGGAGANGLIMIEEYT